MAIAARRIYKKRYIISSQEFHFWIAILLLGIVAFIYYKLQFSWPDVVTVVPLAHSLALWEYSYNFIGSLFYIPVLYSLFLLSWKRLLVIWFLCLFLILPRLIYFYLMYEHHVGRMVIDIFYLSIPILILASISLELKWRNKEKKLYEEKERERQYYLGEVFKAQEEERKRVAREIHDDSIQRLSVIASNTKRLAREEHLENQPVLKEKVDSIQKMIIDVSQDLRRITLDLRPTVLDDLGLVAALRWLVENLKQEGTLDTQVEIIGHSRIVSKQVSIHLFRIVQEALTNAKRHSEATHVQLIIQFTDQRVKVTVRDNGKGFCLPKTIADFTTRGQLGIIGMQQRAQLIDGELLYQSEIGEGTVVSIESKL
jgi:two-component system, NarL family, sensor histidine kinase DegS